MDVKSGIAETIDAALIGPSGMIGRARILCKDFTEGRQLDIRKTAGQ